MAARFLIAGDFHIGRVSSGSARSDATARAAWNRFVELALSERPDAVLVTGDLVDQDRLFIQTLQWIPPGLRQLRDAGIPVVMIAGNHDPVVMRRFAKEADTGTIFLGLEQNGFAQTELRNGWTVVGWSYQPSQQNRVPWETFPDNLPANTIGMLHGTLGSSDDAYARFTEADLRSHPVKLWALGHIHKPGWYEGVNAVYPGSPQALDFGETGLHGAVMMTWEGSGWKHEPIRLSTVRYEILDVLLRAEGDAERQIFQAVQDLVSAVGSVELQLRLRVSGEGDIAEPEKVKQNLRDAFDQIRIDRIDFSVLPPVDLPQLATGSNAQAVAAQLLLHMDGEAELRPELQPLWQDLTSADSLRAAVPPGLRISPEEAREQLRAALKEWVRP